MQIRLIWYAILFYLVCYNNKNAMTELCYMLLSYLQNKMNSTLKINSTPSTSLIVFFVFIGVITMNCVIAQQNSKNKFLIEKIYDDSSQLPEWCFAEFIYDNENKILSSIDIGEMFEQGKLRPLKQVNIFEYENGRVSKVIHKDSTHFMFDYDWHFFYTPQGQLIRSERHKDGYMTFHENYHYQNGRVVSIYGDGTMPFEYDRFFYDNAGNITERMQFITGTAIPYWRTYYYEYDSNPKPSFGIDYLFALPQAIGMGPTLAHVEAGLSKNNITKIYTSDNAPFHKFNYTYNEYGLPETVETMFIDPEYDFVFSYTNRVTYKQVEVGIFEPRQELADVKVYPNPTTGELKIENGELKINNVEIFDVFGRKIEGMKERRSEGVKEVVLDISGLSAGIYFVKIITEKGVAVKKVVKQ